MNHTPRTVKIKIISEVRVKLIGLHGDHLNQLYDRYGIFTASYFHNPKYKLGQWDGKIRFFNKSGETYLYLIEEILPYLINVGYKVEIVDVRETAAFQPDYIDDHIFAHILHPDSGKPIILRDYQINGVNSLIESGYGVCVAGTGAGKTFMCAALVTAYNDLVSKSITIVPDQTLIRQTKRDYINCELDTGEYSGNEKSLHHKHIVSTWQALQHNPDIIHQFDMVIVDECHGLRGNVLQKMITDQAGKIPYRFGFTGTIPKDPIEKMAVHLSVGPERFRIEAHELINKGVLSTIQIDILQLEEDLKTEYDTWCQEECIGKPPTYAAFKDEYFSDFSAEKSYIQRKGVRAEWIANFIETKRSQPKGNVLCLVDNIPFGRKLANMIPGAIFVNGQDVKDAKKRQAIYDLYATNDNLVVIATVHIAGTGLSINRIFHLITIDIGKSFIRVIQAIGRGLRMSDDKNHVSYTDICSDLKYGKKHLTERIKFYKEARYPFKKFTKDYERTTEDIE